MQWQVLPMWIAIGAGTSPYFRSSAHQPNGVHAWKLPPSHVPAWARQTDGALPVPPHRSHIQFDSGTVHAVPEHVTVQTPSRTHEVRDGQTPFGIFWSIVPPLKSVAINDAFPSISSIAGNPVGCLTTPPHLMRLLSPPATPVSSGQPAITDRATTARPSSESGLGDPVWGRARDWDGHRLARGGCRRAEHGIPRAFAARSLSRQSAEWHDSLKFSLSQLSEPNDTATKPPGSRCRETASTPITMDALEAENGRARQHVPSSPDSRRAPDLPPSLPHCLSLASLPGLKTTARSSATDSLSDFSEHVPEDTRLALASGPVQGARRHADLDHLLGCTLSLLAAPKDPLASPADWPGRGYLWGWGLDLHCYDVNSTHLGPPGHPPFSTLPSAPLITAAQCHSPLRRFGIHLISMVLQGLSPVEVPPRRPGLAANNKYPEMTRRDTSHLIGFLHGASVVRERSPPGIVSERSSKLVTRLGRRFPSSRTTRPTSPAEPWLEDSTILREWPSLLRAKNFTRGRSPFSGPTRRATPARF